MSGATHQPDGRPRGRGLGLPFPGQTGATNSIVDVPGVEVGAVTLIRGDGPLLVGQGPVRTGVTAILPRGKTGMAVPVFAGIHSLNGNGELTGSHWIVESGRCEGPLTITNTHSVGRARDASVRWLVQHAGLGASVAAWGLPVAAETYDGYLNDINGFHVTEDDVIAAIDGASAGFPPLGNRGGGTGMICYQFKGGNGSASRVTEAGGQRWTLGAFVQANFGRRDLFAPLGVPAGRLLEVPLPGPLAPTGGAEGSIIVMVGTDAPLLPHQCARVARRVSLGLARTGSVATNGSGDIFLAFSTGNQAALGDGELTPKHLDFLPDAALDPLFEATVQATEEAIVEAMLAADTMTGIDGRTVHALPHGPLVDVMRKFGRV
ncbi:aminopeptidase [Thalassobaculum fulvum]|uniref:Aminopeptidase n=1 Tax=Thalassobaculum fulvum TaxID=1633335 RepID=A0A918XTP4_9PROT|nr:P1 family peptidase [Thalassobaculum fulvum]GHD55357.1 aminopeptidase [Thalassobaculum fulvum]